MNAGERGDELAKIVIDEINGQEMIDTERHIMASRVVRSLVRANLYRREKSAEPDKPKPNKPKPMSDSQAEAFGSSEMPYGIYKGLEIQEIPRSYLCNLVDPSEFTNNLRRYLDNERIKREIES